MKCPDEMSAKIVQETQIAFADIQYPGDDRLVESSGYWELEKLAEQFRGKNWKEVPVTTINRYRFCLSFFTPEAFCYYLPAFILAVRLFPDEVDTLPDNVYYRLTPPEQDGTQMDKLIRIANILNLPQKEVVKQFIQLYLIEEPSSSIPQRERITKFWEL